MATQTVDTIEEAGRIVGDRQSVCSIGVFDGVHLGHRKLLGDAIVEARMRDCVDVIFTFRNHPLSILAPAYAPLLLTPTEEKIERLEALEPSVVLAVEFDHDFADMEPEHFIRAILTGRLHAASVWCGTDFRFGRKGRGDVTMLKEQGAQFGMTLRTVAPVQIHGHVVSSTLIRSLIDEGAVDRARECLGRPYSIRGEVTPGDGRGRRLQFPTANVRLPTGIVLPGDGIYAAHVKAPDKEYWGIVNFGPAPTFGISERRLEAHLLDFEGDLVGQTLAVNFVARLRDIERFDSPEALTEQIRLDERQARGILEALADER